jgi:hypothetical protein
MSQTFTLAPPPASPLRQRIGRQPMETTVQFSRPASKVQPVVPSQKIAIEFPTTAQAPHVATLEVAERSRTTSRTFKRFKSPFSRSAPSSPERPVAPEFPGELSDKVAALRTSEPKAEKPPKKTKPSKAEKKKSDDRIHYHANSSNQRPITYATNVQLEMLMGGGSEEYWLNKGRKVGDGDEEAIGTGVEVGGFKDEDGQIWWDVEEKAEWTSLLPKDEQGLPVTNDMWVDFNTDHRRNSISSESTSSLLSAELLEEMDGPVLYGDVEFEQAHPVYGMQKATGTVLFPIAMGEDSEARAIISQANRSLSSKSAIVIADGFEDHFLSYESCNTSTVCVQVIAPPREIAIVPAPVPGPAKATKKSGLLKSLWGNKQSTRQ